MLWQVTFMRRSMSDIHLDAQTCIDQTLSFVDFVNAYLRTCMYLYILGPEPTFGRLGLNVSSGEYSLHGYTSHASLCAYNAQLRGDRFFEFRENGGPLWWKTVTNGVPPGALSGGKP